MDTALKELGPLSTDGSFQIESAPATTPAETQLQEMAPPEYELGEEAATRSGYGSGLAKLGDANPLVAAVDGDVKNSTYAEQFMQNTAIGILKCLSPNRILLGQGLVGEVR